MLTTGDSEFPCLVTDRLHLRAPQVDDADPFTALLSIPEVTQFSNWPDAPRKAQVERFVRWMTKLFPSGKGCAWVVEDVISKTVIGAVRLNRFDKKWKFGVIGYELHPTFWGRGLMTEALRAVVSCGHRAFRLNRIEAWTLPGNIASERVLEKTGFQYEGTLRQRGWFKGTFHDFRMFGRLAGDPMN
jgi:[ribosomal protein S5]-alanine N-acetyltransferase